MTPLVEVVLLTVFLTVCFAGVGLAIAYAITGLWWQAVSALSSLGVIMVIALGAIAFLLSGMWGAALA